MLFDWKFSGNRMRGLNHRTASLLKISTAFVNSPSDCGFQASWVAQVCDSGSVNFSSLKMFQIDGRSIVECPQDSFFKERYRYFHQRSIKAPPNCSFTLLIIDLELAIMLTTQ